MLFTKLCSPAIIYFIFMCVHVLIALYNERNKEAFLQLLVGFLITLLLQLLCMRKLNIISWIIVFVPFIFYTYLMVLLYSVFGIAPDENMQKFLVN